VDTKCVDVEMSRTGRRGRTRFAVTPPGYLTMVDSVKGPASLRRDGKCPPTREGVGQPGPTSPAADGTELATRCWLTVGGADAIVVVSHGFTANKDDPAVVALADQLHQSGNDVVTYDSRGHGQSGGVCTLGKLEELDVAAIVDWARARTDRVVLIGASTGAVGVLSYPAKDPDLTGVVTVSSPGEWRLPLRFWSLVTAGLARTALGRRWARRKMNVRIAPWSSPDPAHAHMLPNGWPSSAPGSTASCVCRCGAGHQTCDRRLLEPGHVHRPRQKHNAESIRGRQRSASDDDLQCQLPGQSGQMHSARQSRREPLLRLPRSGVG
jgi:pimeloyl-ACP methyl ester carboxylesterase